MGEVKVLSGYFERCFSVNGFMFGVMMFTRIMSMKCWSDLIIRYY